MGTKKKPKSSPKTKRNKNKKYVYVTIQVTDDQLGWLVRQAQRNGTNVEKVVLSVIQERLSADWCPALGVSDGKDRELRRIAAERTSKR